MVPQPTTTDFGAPAAISEHDRRPLTRAALERQLACLTAAWAALDDVAARAPKVLRKGPRGGGRDRDAVVAHVLEAERAYGRKVGVRSRHVLDHVWEIEDRSE